MVAHSINRLIDGAALNELMPIKNSVDRVEGFSIPEIGVRTVSTDRKKTISMRSFAFFIPFLIRIAKEQPRFTISGVMCLGRSSG